jgi:hypothetical protein
LQVPSNLIFAEKGFHLGTFQVRSAKFAYLLSVLTVPGHVIQRTEGEAQHFGQLCDCFGELHKHSLGSITPTLDTFDVNP